MENQKHESETVAAREASGTRSIGISAPQPIAIQTLALNALKGFRKFYWLFFLIISVLSSYFYTLSPIIIRCLLKRSAAYFPISSSQALYSRRCRNG